MHSLPPARPAPVHDALPATSLLAAAGAALLGALAWAVVIIFTGYEIGWVAWGLGGLVGYALVRFGGRGTAAATLAAGLTLVGIAGGKLLGSHFAIAQGIEEIERESFTRELHAELLRDAADLAELGTTPSEDELRVFILEHGYAPAQDPAEITAEELATFTNDNLPRLRKLESEQPSFEQWYAASCAEGRAIFARDFSLISANVENLGPVDLVFALLGLSTAFGLVRRASTTPQAAPPASRADADETRRAA
jgi:hypothetical protein